jgi:hypothetical protein
MKTINFCGDSFCKKERVSAAWTTLLADKLNASIIGWGKGGFAHEYAIKTFDDTADYTIFCWTEAHRLHVNQTYSTNLWTLEAMCEPHKLELPLSMRLKELPPTNRDKAAYAYYKYLYDPVLHHERQIRDLYWFDNVVLPKYKGVAVHIFCFRNTYTFTNGINVSDILQQRTREYQLKKLNPDYTLQDDDFNNYANHLTEQENSGLADRIYNIIKEHHEKTNYK